MNHRSIINPILVTQLNFPYKMMNLNIAPKFTDTPESNSSHLVALRNEKQYHVSDKISESELQLLKRLPSTAQRHIDIEKINNENDVVVLRSNRGRILLLTYYKNFGDFVYVHTSIGRDEYKEFLYTELAEITTKIAPTYFVIFQSEESIRVVNLIGAKLTDLNEFGEGGNGFMNEIAKLTNRPFYQEDGLLFDSDDTQKQINPLFVTTRESFLKSMENEHLKAV